ncbi:MAG: hypothetical protein HETSPECPRED_009769 [Heterodermia speciosa]|uniref:Uncharacterized protein n=1 Tax=Heterodermia speciosa TaxID=116794 RepID=A0A8H3G9E4_9LECA|nr:MAG: hypothetical protein HETSPECPRED_009769 [Heterodermia speciosa]
MRYTTYGLLASVLLVATIYATTTEITSNFDNLPGSVALGQSKPFVYNGLTFSSWVPVSFSLSLVGGIRPKSPKIAILTSAAIQSNSGTPFFTAAAPYKSFTLLDFYFGCNVPTQEGVVDKTTQCSILVSGFRKSDGKEVASASFTFTPPQGLTAQMIEAVLPDSFAGVYNVTVVQANPVAQSLYVDNVHYKLSK